MNDRIKLFKIDLTPALRATGEMLADTITISFGPMKSRELRRQAAKLTTEADVVDARVAEARARLGVRRG